MPELTTITSAPPLPATVSPGTAPTGGDGDPRTGKTAATSPGTAAIAPPGEDAAKQTGEASPGGFERLLIARVALADTAANDALLPGNPGAAPISRQYKPETGRDDRPGLVATVLAETASLTAALQSAQQAGAGVVPAFDGSTPAESETIPPAPSEAEASADRATLARNRSARAVSDPDSDESGELSANGDPPPLPDAAAFTPPPLIGVDSGSSRAHRAAQDEAANAVARPGGWRAPGAAEQPDRAERADRPVAPAPDAADSAGKREAPALRTEATADSVKPGAAAETTRLPDMPPRIETPSPAEMSHAGAASAVRLAQPLGSPEWGREFGAQVTLFVSRKETRADIRVNPPELGPVEVRIGFEGDRVSVAFSAIPAETRDAIQNALPQLRELLAERGLSLGNATVGAESSPREFAPAPRSGATPHATGEARPIEQRELRLARHLVDTFA